MPLSPDRLAALVVDYATPPPRRETPSAARVMDEAVTHVRPFENEQVAVYAWGPAGVPTVLLVHGWGSRAADMAGFVRPLLRAGRRVVAFDAPAHGASTGDRTSMLQMARLVRTLTAENETSVSVLGHSIGAAATVYAAALASPLPGAPAAVERLVLVGLPASLSTMTRQFTERHGLDETSHQVFVRAVEETYGITVAAFEVARVAPSLPVPVLLIHDRADPKAPFAATEAAAALFPEARLTVTEGLDHAGTLMARDVIRAAVDFLTA